MSEGIKQIYNFGEKK